MCTEDPMRPLKQETLKLYKAMNCKGFADVIKQKIESFSGGAIDCYVWFLQCKMFYIN